MPILIISGFSNVTGNQILIPQGRDSQFMIAVVTGAVVDVIGNAILMPTLGCTGAAIATLIAEFAQMSVQFCYCKKDIMPNINIQTIIKALIAATISGLVCGILRRLVDIMSIINLLITSIVFFAVYAIILILMKEPYLMEIIQFVRKKLLRV